MSVDQPPQESYIKYRLLSDAFNPPEDHDKVGDDVYLAESDDGLIDNAEAIDFVEVLDWEYQRDTEIEFDGPPEPAKEPGEPARLLVPDEHEIRSVELGTFVCQRCGQINDGLAHNGELQHPGQCDNCERQGPFDHVASEDLGDMNPAKLADPMWELPTGVDDAQYDQLWEDVREWIYKYWVAGDGNDHIYEGLTAFALSTWIRPNLDFLPHIMVMGQFSGGKTRLLNTLARISYRGVAPVSLTAPSLFRSLDVYNVTMFISEYHDLPYELREEIDAVIKGAQKRGEMVLRAQGNADGSFDPDWFRIFSHIGIGTQYDPADDIISRCLYIQTAAADREIPMRFREENAAALRDRLLYMRFRLLESDEWAEAEAKAEQWLHDRGIKHRLAEKLLCLVTLANLWDRLEEIEPFVEEVVEESKDAKAESEDASFVRVIRDMAMDEVSDVQTLGDADPWGGLKIPLSTVCERFEEMEGKEMSPSKAGQLRKRLNLDKEKTRSGTVIRDDELKSKLRRLCQDNNLEWTVTEAGDPVVELPDEKITGQSKCSECGKVRYLTHKDRVEGHYMCGDCADELREAQGS